MKLWIKIVLLNAAIVVSLGIVIGLTIRETVTNTMRVELTKQGESLARNLSDRIAASILLDDFYKTQEAIEDVIAAEHDIEYIYVTDKNGYLFAHTFKNGYPPDVLRWNPMLSDTVFSIQLLDTEKGFIRDIGLRVFGGMNPEVHIGIKEERIEQTLNRMRNLIIALTVIVTLIGSVLSCSLSRIITKPLLKLMDFTHALSRGEFGGQVDIKTKDEVGDLFRTFNNLSYQLFETNREGATFTLRIPVSV